MSFFGIINLNTNSKPINGDLFRLLVQILIIKKILVIIVPEEVNIQTNLVEIKFTLMILREY